MKTPILLKVLQISPTKANPHYKNTRSRNADKGFTLLEVLVIALIVGILSSIAAPSWLAFINRQRVRTVNDRVLQSLRSAQSEAKRSKRDVTVTFYTSSSTPISADPPRVEIDTNPAEPDPLKKEIRKETFSSGGEIKPRTIAISTNATAYTDGYAVPANSIVFDYKGNVKQLPLDSNNNRRLVVSVAPFDTSVPSGFGPNTKGKQCVIVETILGGMRTAEGNDPVTGCP
ncbi:type II secretion system protein [Microcoleus sp. F10-C6]|uniref:type II secretion system protein n=1 Tax=unclassified Microcoleus TaxID=2642155 RepID=UPI002FD1C747